jgi:hypothetical protein
MNDIEAREKLNDEANGQHAKSAAELFLAAVRAVP